jgi:acetylornithine deacetylase/succinyl-diaminopimelate desuccinylase-like protein
MKDVNAYINTHRDRFIQELFALISQPSISTQNVGVTECAGLLKNQIEAIGIPCRVISTPGHPVVFGEVKAKRPARTVLIYGHYDVQPPEPLDLWTSPPFEPVIREGRIWGRGSGDNKGQFFAHLKAVETLLAVRGEVPVNVKFLFEGEEEVGSRNLRAFMAENRSMLAADFCFGSDGGMYPDDQPVVLFGVRGTLNVEVTARGANRDVHSGNLGVFVPNAAWRLVEFLNTLRDAEGRCRIKGFNDAVVPPTDLEREAMGKIAFDPALLGSLGLPEPPREAGAGYYERLMFQPAVNICGLTSGYGGPGMKTIIPHTATVKIDMRLVVDQDPEDIFERFRSHAAEHGFGDLEIRKLGAFYPSRTALDHPLGRAAARAVLKGFGREPLLLPCMGGSDPDYYFTRVLGIPRVNVPYAPHDENNHSPNESIKVEGFFNGIRTTAAFLDEAAGL